ncbi:uncharacterized protein LOC124944814 [Impatiens glandulifera]|uniref:uncharacterized protein LOC124944814 n=1 Tax=Impatiens glandulifera TaxID=253017 RepID=UPI001FB09EFC|nr:uncharacterized protein LOC124944814 [Impatiens glandulifera]
MEGEGSCCIAGGGGVGDYEEEASKAQRIMLKFRPIAPKPTGGGGGGGGHVSERDLGRKRRRYRVGVVTLPLLGEINNNNNSNRNRVITPRAPTSIVTVERLTETWVEEYGLGYSDGERVSRLNMDACPGFVSDGFGRVIWTNGAYRREIMVDEGGGGGGEVLVFLVIKEENISILIRGAAAFTCRVRLQYGCRSMASIPCDAWRMDAGGFAWRLDMKAALTLRLPR